MTLHIYEGGVGGSWSEKIVDRATAREGRGHCRTSKIAVPSLEMGDGHGISNPSRRAYRG